MASYAEEDVVSAIVERSARSGLYVFAKMLLEDVKISQVEMGILLDMYRVLPISKLDIVVYLNHPLETCLSRIALRGRESERTIDLHYLNRIEECYSSFLTACEADGIRVIHVECGAGTPEEIAERVETALAEVFLPRNDLPMR